MKIKLTRDLPVNPVHGMKAGRELDVIEFDPEATMRTGGVRYWVIGDIGERVGVLKVEADVIEIGDSE